MKSEKLKKQFTETYCWPDEDVHYAGFKSKLRELLEQYAAEVSREMAAKFACEMNFNERADFRELPEEYYDDYDNWIKQQEEKK